MVSPSISKTKTRRATTLGSERKGKKVFKTYGSKDSQDIFEFRGSSDGEQDLFCSKISGSITKPRDTTDRPFDSKSQEDTPGTGQYGKSGSHEAELHEYMDKLDSHPASGDRQITTSRAGIQQDPLLLSLVKPAIGTHTQVSESSTITTIPFSTPAEPTPTKDVKRCEFQALDDRMPTPTVSSKSHNDAEKAVNSSQSNVVSAKRSIVQMELPTVSFEQGGDAESDESWHLSKRICTDEDPDVPLRSEAHQAFEQNIAQKEQPTNLSSMIDTLLQSLPHATDRLVIESTIRECGGNVDLAASRLLDAEEQGGPIDELSLSMLGGARTRSSKSDKKPQLQDRRHKDELGSDEVENSLPKEQYQPRPSRSRSGQVNGDDPVIPVDFSRRPEALVKPKKSKRRKTTALAKAAPKYEEEDEEDVIPLFSIQIPAKAVDSESKTSWEDVKPADTNIPGVYSVAHTAREATSASILPASKKQRGRPQKKAMDPSQRTPGAEPLVNDEVQELDAETAEDPTIEETAELSKLSALKKQRGRPHKRAAESLEEVPPESLIIDNDEEEPDGDLVEDLPQDPDNNDFLSAAETQAAKKQRGRPKKKAAKPPEVPPSGIESYDESADLTVTKNSRKRKKSTIIEPPIIPSADDPPSSLNANSHTRQTPLTETQANTNPMPSTKSSSSPIKSPQQQPETPQKQKGPDKHSPLQSGKVRYRVGLSKRARIEPLLRVVRK